MTRQATTIITITTTTASTTTTAWMITVVVAVATTTAPTTTEDLTGDLLPGPTERRISVNCGGYSSFAEAMLWRRAQSAAWVRSVTPIWA